MTLIMRSKASYVAATAKRRYEQLFRQHEHGHLYSGMALVLSHLNKY